MDTTTTLLYNQTSIDVTGVLGTVLAYIGATLPLLGGIFGSTIGLAIAGISGTAALADDPKQFRNVFMLAALPMTQTFYGLITMLQLISTIKSLEKSAGSLNLATGVAILGLGLMAAFAEFLSAWYQGKICASGINELPRTKGAIAFNTLVLAVYVELIGILGMVFSIMGLSLIRAALGV